MACARKPVTLDLETDALMAAVPAGLFERMDLAVQGEIMRRAADIAGHELGSVSMEDAGWIEIEDLEALIEEAANHVGAALAKAVRRTSLQVVG